MKLYLNESQGLNLNFKNFHSKKNVIDATSHKALDDKTVDNVKATAKKLKQQDMLVFISLLLDMAGRA